VNTWQDRDESTNFFQKYDGELVKDALRPVVFEEVRLDVDEEMRVLLENLKVRLARSLFGHRYPYRYRFTGTLTVPSRCDESNSSIISRNFNRVFTTSNVEEGLIRY
jgi:hypothetical protein